MMMQIVGAFVEFERAMLRERTKAGLESRPPGKDESADVGLSYRFNSRPDGLQRR